ncbi:MAG: DRTGG domain-containing protein, partial [Dehalococcoidia bacterium]
TVAEAPSWEGLAALRADSAGAVIIVTRYGEADASTLRSLVDALNPAAVVLNAVPSDAMDSAEAAVAGLGVPLLAAIPQDRLLAAPLIQAMAAAIDGELSGADDVRGEAAEWLQIGPISAHEGIDYFSRYPDKAVVTRHDKVDVALAALDSEPACLILTGGSPSLPYIAQRAESEEFALIVTGLDTPQTVARIGELYAHSPFAGSRKVARGLELLDQNIDQEVLRRLTDG